MVLLGSAFPISKRKNQQSLGKRCSIICNSWSKSLRMYHLTQRFPWIPRQQPENGTAVELAHTKLTCCAVGRTFLGVPFVKTILCQVSVSFTARRRIRAETPAGSGSRHIDLIALPYLAQHSDQHDCVTPGSSVLRSVCSRLEVCC